MLLPFPLELFPFPLVAQHYSFSSGNPMGMGIPISMHISSLYATPSKRMLPPLEHSIW